MKMNRMVSFPSTPLLLAQISVDVCACVCILRGPGILAFLRYVIKDTRAFGLQCTGHGVLCRNIFILGQSRKSISQGSMALNMKTKKKKKAIPYYHSQHIDLLSLFSTALHTDPVGIKMLPFTHGCSVICFPFGHIL